MPGLLRRRCALTLTVCYGIWASLLITNFSPHLFKPEPLDQVFDDMAYRLLSWDFRISPSAIRWEAFVRDGQTYTYFGMLPALFRLPLVLAGARTVHLARVSCLIATTSLVYLHLRTLQVASLGWVLPAGPARRLVLVLLLGTAGCGPAIYLLASASLYHEIIFWAATLTACFNLIVLKAWFGQRELRQTELIALAVLAGCCLLCRAPEGVGLLACLLFLLARHVTVHVFARPDHARSRMAWLGQVIAPGITAFGFVIIYGVINYERWDNPLEVGPLRYYVQLASNPAWLDIFLRHGAFAWTRVEVAALYYLAAIKVETVFPQYFNQYYPYIEGPRSLFALCAPLTMVFALSGVVTLCRLRKRAVTPLLLLAGQLVGIGLVLGFPALTIRYTFIFWAVLVPLAAIGMAPLKHIAALSRRALTASVCLLLVGAAISHLTLLRYKLVSVGTEPEVQLRLSTLLQPIVCPSATIKTSIDPSDVHQLITPSCPPLW